MKSTENGILSTSEYYVYTPSIQAEKIFFYPISVGHFFYSKSYTLERHHDDSFLIMFIKKGSFKLTIDGTTYTVSENQVAIIDCNKFHSYKSITDWETLWIHFKGPVSHEYYNTIIKKSGTGHVIDLYDTLNLDKRFNIIYDIFKNKEVVKEFLVSKYICDLLTELLLAIDNKKGQIENNSNIVDNAIKFMREHLTENITLSDISTSVSLSPYYFSRLFKNETSFSPHQYLISMRIDLAKFLLKNTSSSIKQICFNTGFNSESMFCTTFKQRTGISPSGYRDLHWLNPKEDINRLPHAPTPKS